LIEVIPNPDPDYWQVVVWDVSEKEPVDFEKTEWRASSTGRLPTALINVVQPIEEDYVERTRQAQQESESVEEGTPQEQEEVQEEGVGDRDEDG
jgi:hypothetical protein